MGMALLRKLPAGVPKDPGGAGGGIVLLLDPPGEAILLGPELPHALLVSVQLRLEIFNLAGGCRPGLSPGRALPLELGEVRPRAGQLLVRRPQLRLEGGLLMVEVLGVFAAAPRERREPLHFGLELRGLPRLLLLLEAVVLQRLLPRRLARAMLLLQVRHLRAERLVGGAETVFLADPLLQLPLKPRLLCTEP